MRITGLCAAAGAVIGAVIGVVLHVLVWRPSGSTVGMPRRYVNYLAVGSAPRATVRLYFGTTGGSRATWWPLLPVTMAVGLITAALIGAVVLVYQTSTPEPI